jgi:hypothetical protein
MRYNVYHHIETIITLYLFQQEKNNTIFIPMRKNITIFIPMRKTITIFIPMRN